MSRQRVSFVEAFLWGIGGVAAIFGLGKIINNRQTSPNLRFIAQTIEGVVVQDLETGLFHLLV